jgi:hypothetical protein
VEDSLFKQLRDGLESGELLPTGLHATILRQEFTSTKRVIRPDLVVEFTVDERKTCAVVEFKSRLTPLTLEGAIYQVSRYSEAIRGIEDRFRQIVPMVAAPYLSENLRNRCKQIGVGYIDLNGSIFLRTHGFYVDVLRPATRFKNPQNVRNIFSGKSRRIIRTLLTQPHHPFRLEAIARETALSTARVFQVVKKLDSERFLERTPKGRILTGPARLLRLFVEETKDDFKKNRLVFNGFSELPMIQIASRLREYCASMGREHAFTLSTGLELNERNLREDIVAAYVDTDPQIIADDLRIEAVGRGANVFLMRAPEPDNTSFGGVFYRPRILSNGFRGINPVQLYLDFSLYPNRGQEQALFMMNNVLGFRG